jgi:uncharacterized protein YjlB
MPLLEDLKAYGERMTGLSRPKPSALKTLVRRRPARKFLFRDDGETPNSRWPLVLYRSAVVLKAVYDPAAIFEELFAQNGWTRSWRDAMYDWLHYHSNTHEVLGVARGHLQARIGGAHGRMVRVKAGDVMILPAGVGHNCVHKSADLLIVGAYPGVRGYDECGPKDTDNKVRARIRRVPRPPKDPVYGAKGPLLAAWKHNKSGASR